MDGLYTMLIPNELVTPEDSPLGALLTKLLRSHADGINYKHDTVSIDGKDFKRIMIENVLYNNPIFRRDVNEQLEMLIVMLGGDIINKQFFVKKPLNQKTAQMIKAASATIPGSSIPAPFTNAVESTTIEAEYPNVTYLDENDVERSKTWEEYEWTTNWQGQFKEDDSYFYVQLSNGNGSGPVTGKQAFFLSSMGSEIITKEEYQAIGNE